MQILRKTVKDPDFIELNSVQKGSWINSMNPSKEEVQKLITELKLDEEIIEDFLDENSVPRIETDEGITYFLIRVPVTEKKLLKTTTLGIVVTEAFILTMTPESSLQLINYFLENKNIFTTQKTKFVLRLLDKTIESYEKKTDYLNKEVNKKRRQLQKLSNQDIATMVEFEESLNDFISALVPITIIINKIKAGKILQVYEQDQELLEDLLISANDSLQLSKSRIKTITNIREAHTTILSNNLNKTMKLLTAITIVLTIPTIISSIYGMNIPLPIQAENNAFLYIIIIILLISAGLILVFKKQDWI
ncbi:MAG: magnesium transporter CorA family protein [Candidatus Diapherotrites archaeon]